jgi:hypothetical protein
MAVHRDAAVNAITSPIMGLLHGLLSHDPRVRSSAGIVIETERIIVHRLQARRANARN